MSELRFFSKKWSTPDSFDLAFSNRTIFCNIKTSVKNFNLGSGESPAVWPDWAFFKFLVNKFLSKVAQIISNFLGYFEKPYSYIKTAVATSRVTFGNILAAFCSNIWSHW